MDTTPVRFPDRLIQCVTPKCPAFFTKKTLEKWETLGTFTQKVPFLDYNKTKKKGKSGTVWGETLWGHALYKGVILKLVDVEIYKVLIVNFF